MHSKGPGQWLDDQEIVAGNGLLHRSGLLTDAAALARALCGYSINEAAHVKE